MLSASQCGARSPLSPLTQTTLEKHLPGLPTKRLLQQKRIMKVDVGCVTGKHFIDRIHSNMQSINYSIDVWPDKLRSVHK